MSIFGGLSTPQWASPDQESAWSSEQGSALANIWMQKDQAEANNDYRDQVLDMKVQALHVAQQKQAQAADWLHGNGADGNPVRPWEVVSQHPELLLDPATQKGTSAILKSSFEASRIQAGSAEAKIALQQTGDFTKQLNVLNNSDPESVAAIRSMSKAQDGSPSAGQWQALSLAQQRSQVAAKTELAQAEIDARARGDNVTVATGPKGQTITARTPIVNPNAGVTVEPQLKTFPDGTSVIYNPKGGGFHLLQQDGKTKPMSTAEMTKLYTSSGVDDTWKQSLGDELKRRSVPAGATGLLPLPSSKAALKSGQKYQTGRGPATWNGTNFVQ